VTGLSALGPPKGNPLSDKLLQAERLPHEIERRLWTAHSDLDGSSGGGLVTETVGPAAAMGKGIADSSLAMLRGVHWLGSHAALGPIGAKAFDQVLPRDKLPQNIYDLLPEEAGLRLAARIGAASSLTTGASEMVGGLIPLVSGGGALGKAVGLPGQAIKGLGWPGHKVGEALAKVPQVARWTKTAQALPPMLGTSTGFGLYNYITADGDTDQRVAAGVHGMIAGAVLGGAGLLARAVEAKILSGSLSGEQAVFLGNIARGLRSNQLPTWEKWDAAAKMVSAKGAAGLIEGLGFAGLNEEFWKAAVNGDPKATEIYVGSVAAALLARTGDPNGYLFFRRNNPNLNDFSLRREVLDVRRARTEARRAGQEPVDAEFREVDPGEVRQEPQRQLAAPAEPVPPDLDALTRPLFHSGWEIPDYLPNVQSKRLSDLTDADVSLKDAFADPQAPPAERPVVDLEFPGSGRVQFLEGPSGLQLEVPPEVFRIVRGDMEGLGDGPVRMEGPVAEEFARDLAAVSMMRRMGGEIQFRGQEAWAGGPWVGQDGRHYTIGLDGKTYARRNPPAEGEPWKPVAPQRIDLSVKDKDPTIQRWMDLSNALRGMATPNPGLDLIETSVLTAINGNPQSPSVQELRMFLSMADPQIVAQALTPQSVQVLGEILGAVGSGHATAAHAGQRLPELVAAAQQEGVAEGVAGDTAGATGRQGEAGFVDIGAIAEGVAEGAMAVGSAAKRLADYTTEQQAEVIRKAMPGETISFEGRRAMSKFREVRGEAQALWQPGEKAARRLGSKWIKDTTEVADGKGSYATWELLADRKLRVSRETKPPVEGEAGPLAPIGLVPTGRLPANKDEESFVSAVQQMGTYLWGRARGSGMARQGRKGIEWLPERDRSYLPRVPGKDVDTVMGDTKLRRAWFRLLEQQNPGEVTVRSLEEKWRKGFGAKTEVKDIDIDSAIEHYRKLRNVPHFLNEGGKSYEMRLSNPFEVVRSVMERQARNISAHEVFGSDWTPQERAELAKQAGKDDPGLREVREGALAKGGPKAAMAEWRQKFFGEEGPSMPKNRKEAISGALGEWLETIQGGAPVKAGTYTRFLQNVGVIPKSARTVKAFLYDLPEILTMPMLYLGPIRALRGYRRILELGGPKEAIRFYERLGAIRHNMGDLLWEEAQGLASRVASGLGVVGTATERFKTAVYAATADVLLADWKAGKASPGHAELLNELRFPPDAAAALLTGNFSPELGAQFRNEIVTLMTARGERGEGSRMVDNPIVMAHLWFARFAAGRMIAIRRRIADLIEAKQKHGVGSRKFRRAALRLAAQTAFFTGTGLGSFLLMYMAAAWLQGDDLKEGVDRLGREMNDSIIGTLGKAYARQATGGPTTQIAEAVTDPTRLDNWTSLTVPTDLLHAGLDALHASNRKDAGFLMEFLGEAGYLPLYADMRRLGPKLMDWYAAEAAGEVMSKRPEAISDGQVAWEFRRANVKRGILGLPIDETGDFPQSKAASFYSAMRSAMAEAYRGAAQVEGSPEEQAKAGFTRARDNLVKALAEDEVTPESLAGYIRSKRHFNGWKQQDVAAFEEYLGDERRMERMLQHDRMLLTVARAAGRLVDEAAPEWESDIADFRKLVAMGGGDVKGMVDQAVEKAARSISLQTNSPDQVRSEFIHELAPVLAQHDWAIRETFTGGFGEALLTVPDRSRRALYIEGELLDRAWSRFDSRLRKEMEDAARK